MRLTNYGAAELGLRPQTVLAQKPRSLFRCSALPMGQGDGLLEFEKLGKIWEEPDDLDVMI